MSETTSDDRDDASPVSARPREGSTGHGRPLGFVGLNGLGLAAAVRLATRFPLLGCDEDPGRLSLLVDRAPGPSEVHTTPILAELAERCDIIAVLRHTAADAGQTIADLASRVGAGTMLLDMSVSDPSSTRRIAAELSDRSVHLLDATLVGTEEQAASGKLLILAGGAEAVLSEARLYLEHLGTLLHVGAIGAGDCAAALLGAVAIAGARAIPEVRLIAEKNGIRPGLLDALLDRGEGIATPGALRIAVSLGGEVGVATPVLGAALGTTTLGTSATGEESQPGA